MAPRPRPTHEPSHLARQGRPKAIDFLSESEGAEHAHSPAARLHEAHDDDNGSDDDDISVDSERDEEDIDAPRVAQWIDDEDLELQEQVDDISESDSEEEEDNDRSTSEAGPSRKLRSLEHDLSTLPLGTLRSAQRSLARAQALSDSESNFETHSESDVTTSEDGDPSHHPTRDKHAKTLDWPSQLKNAPTKRSSKHAPAEVTSKRPVSRYRMVTGDNLPKPRDPRFMHAAGRYDPTKFKQRYEFLSDLRDNELATLRGHVKRARRLVANSPVHLRADRNDEVKRLERAMKRAESTVNLDNRERVELKALQSAKQAEKEKRKQGKAQWWMKRSEKKELLAKARLDAIASVGGRRAVKKAIEKKRKKIGQKEKRMRPFSQNDGVGGPDGKKRRPVGAVDSGRGSKRRRV